ncbi:MAG: [Fe-Fe] hydrogenase large subunit C-terminal domain-containing protein, partial [Breznakiellaceae bacterium]
DEEPITQPATAAGRGFAWSGGVAQAVLEHLPDKKGTIQTATIDGLSRESIKELQAWAKGKTAGQLLEVMACTGGCVAGPSVITNPKVALMQLKKLVQEAQPS